MKPSRTKFVAIASGAVLAGGALAGTLAASSASAATVNVPKPVPHACAYNLTGGNVLDLTYLGTTYTYPVVLHEANDGLITGFLLDKGLPVGHQLLAVHGVCAGSDVDLGVNYPTADPQGQRVDDLNITRIGLSHYGKAAGVWTETGTEAGSGAASLQYPVRHF
jgi:hypothetical protein